MIISAQGLNVRNAVAAARKVAKLPLRGNEEKIRSGGEDNCYRVTLVSGHIVEVHIKYHARSRAHIVQY